MVHRVLLVGCAAAVVFFSLVQAVMAQSPFSYFRVQTTVAPASFGDVSWIDLEGDGDQDLLVVASEGSGARVPTTAVYEQVSTIWAPAEDGIPRPTGEYRIRPVADARDLWLSDIDWADYDLDGDLDAVVSGASQTTPPWSPTVQFYDQSAPGVLTARDAEGVTAILGVVRWADVDNDGDADLLAMGRTENGQASTGMYRNNGAAFQAMDVDLPAASFGDAAWSDFDRDGDLDLALCGATPDGTYVTALYVNEGSWSFSELEFDGVGLVFCSLEWGDYDQDGFPDLLISGGRTSALVLEGVTRVYRNVGGTTFQEQTFELSGVVGGSTRWIDVDNDGASDIVVSGGRDPVLSKAVARIYRNEPDGFRLVSNLSGTFPGRLEPGDFDADGDLDLVMIGLDRGGLAITNVFMNGELLVNTIPSVPSDFESQVNGGNVRLEWSPATDEQTRAEGLTYNLRIGTEPGGGDVMSVPVAIDGRPMRSAAGNVGHNTSWTVRDLPNGTYYWGVQAVDNSYTASAFSPASSFEVTASSGSKPVSDESVDGVPGSLRLGSPYPNPAASNVRFDYDVPRAGPARLEVFDAVGRLVNTLVDRAVAAGRHAESWDGRDASGRALASGIYLIRLTGGGQERLSTVALLR